jgi:hypothetical protein
VLERRRQRRVHAVEAADQMQIGWVHRRRLERYEQLAATGVKRRRQFPLDRDAERA